MKALSFSNGPFSHCSFTIVRPTRRRQADSPQLTTNAADAKQRSLQLFKSTEDVVTGKVQNDLSTNLSNVYHLNMNELEAHLKAKGTKFLFRDDKPSEFRENV